MIRRLTGAVVDTVSDGVVIDVHGVGYFVHTDVHGRTVPINSEACFFTHLSVRETALDIYGFLDKTTLDVFELLITIPKIGPKSALQILEQADTATLIQATKNNDAGILTKMAGIGKKTAERIVSGLGEKIDNLDTAYTNTQEAFQETEALDTLIALGYPPNEAREALKGIDTSTTLNEQVRAALRNL